MNIIFNELRLHVRLSIKWNSRFHGPTRCGTGCHQHCMAAASSGGWRLFGQSWTPPGVVVAFLCDSGVGYKWHDLLIYLFTYNNNRSFNMVKTHAQPYKYIIHVYVYNTTNSLSRSQDSNNAAHTLPRRTATTQGFSTGE